MEGYYKRHELKPGEVVEVTPYPDLGYLRDVVYGLLAPSLGDNVVGVDVSLEVTVHLIRQPTPVHGGHIP